MTPEQQAIVRAAQEQGISPAFALAIAERESNFNPHARNSKTIRGMFQMRGDLRQKYGVGDSDDPYTQASGWGKFIGGVRGEMKGTLGRDPTDAETYLGHHFGGVRAAKMLGMAPDTPVDAVFTPNELAQNPHIVRAGTVGALNSTVESDINKRMSSYGGQNTQLADLSSLGELVQAPDLSSFGELAEAPDKPDMSGKSPAMSAPDLSAFGTPV